MEKLIVSVLKENGRVIIPDFGAFIIKSKSPFKVIFNEFLQYNDGALIGATASNFNIERDEAANKVKDFASKLVAKLDKGEAVSLPEIGVLSKSATGKIALEEGGGDKTPEPTTKKEAGSSTVEFDVTEEKKEAQKTPTPPAKKPELKTSAKPEPKKVDKPIQPTKAKATPTPIPSKKEVIVAKKETPAENVEKKEEPAEVNPIAEYYEDDSNRSVKLILWIVLLVLVNGAIVGFFLFDDEIKGLFGKNKPVLKEHPIETPSITDEDMIVKDSTKSTEEELVIAEPQDETIEDESPSKILTGKKYYVVAGVFSEEANADRLVIELRKKGYNSEKFGKIGAMHAVSYDVFPTKPEADKLMLKIKREVDAEAWIRVIK